MQKMKNDFVAYSFWKSDKTESFPELPDSKSYQPDFRISDENTCVCFFFETHEMQTQGGEWLTLEIRKWEIVFWTTKPVILS